MPRGRVVGEAAGVVRPVPEQPGGEFSADVSAWAYRQRSLKDAPAGSAGQLAPGQRSPPAARRSSRGTDRRARASLRCRGHSYTSELHALPLDQPVQPRIRDDYPPRFTQLRDQPEDRARSNEDRGTVLTSQAESGWSGPTGRVERRGRLVGDQRRRLQQAASTASSIPLAHATREADPDSRPVGPTGSGIPDVGQRSTRPPARVPRPPVSPPCARGHRVAQLRGPDRERRVQAAVSGSWKIIELLRARAALALLGGMPMMSQVPVARLPRRV